MARPGGTSSPLSPKSPLDGTSRIPRFSPLSSPSPLRRSGSQRVHKTDLFPSIAENSNANNHTPPIRRSNSLKLDSPVASLHGLTTTATTTTTTTAIPIPRTTTTAHHNSRADSFFQIIKQMDRPCNSSSSHSCPSSLSLTPLRSRRSCGRGGNNDDFSDNDSVRSFGSTASGCCDHPHFALNGTTWSARSRRFLVHCSGSIPPEPGEYRTPTQRAAVELRQAHSQLRQAAKEIEDKDRQISQLTQELVELRLTYKQQASSSASSPSPNSQEEISSRPDKATIAAAAVEAATMTTSTSNGVDQPDSKAREVESLEVAVSSSLVDSGHFDASSTSSTTALSKESVAAALGLEDSPQRRRYVDEIQELKQNYNDRVEALLYQLSEMSTRYFEAKPRLDTAEARCKQLEKEAEELRAKLEQHKLLLAEQEERNKQMYLKMYAKGQEAARMEQADQITEQDPNNPSTITLSDLLKKLSITEAELENTRAQAQQEHSSCAAELLALASRCQSLLTVEEAVSLWVLGTRKALYRRLVESKNQEAQDPEITLQFLKSAVYYFLTDKENLHGHLKAIESILGFTDAEKLNIDKVYGSARK